MIRLITNGGNDSLPVWWCIQQSTSLAIRPLNNSRQQSRKIVNCSGYLPKTKEQMLQKMHSNLQKSLGFNFHGSGHDFSYAYDGQIHATNLTYPQSLAPIQCCLKNLGKAIYSWAVLLAPLSCMVQLYEYQNQWKTWGDYTAEEWHIVPILKHYQCH